MVGVGVGGSEREGVEAVVVEEGAVDEEGAVEEAIRDALNMMQQLSMRRPAVCPTSKVGRFLRDAR